jgi:DNA-binding XRE family transcriptional regulator
MPTEQNNRFYKKSMNQWIFNQMIFDEREAHSFSQEEMGRLLQVSKSSINAYEMKKIKPSIEVIIEFLKVFNKKIFIVDRDENVEEFDFKERTDTHFKY